MSLVEFAWVIDTSCLTDIRRHNLDLKTQKQVFIKLSSYVEDGRLFYPKQVVKELERVEGEEDDASVWAEENQEIACELTPMMNSESILQVLQHPQARLVLDTEKTSGVEEADPYILAMALDLRGSGKYKNVIVLTQEKRDRKNKLSLSSACGLLELVCLPIKPFLIQQGIVRKIEY